MLTVTKIESSDDQLKHFWELDAIGIRSHQEYQRTPEEEDTINQFNNSCRFDGERYEVGLPWKKDHPPLVDNYGQAYQRLVSTERRLAKDSGKARMYCEAVSQYIEDGHARPIDEEDHKADKIRYLLHHGVFREDRVTTKCRVVFDSSAKTYDGQSLNSCLLKAPKTSARSRTCSNQIQVPSGRYHGRYQENVSSDQAQTPRSEQSQIPVERSAYPSRTGYLLHDPSDIRR